MIFILNTVCYAQDFTCHVKHVHDGDTFTCGDDTKIRTWGIDTPEVPPAVKRSTAERNNGFIARDYLKSYIK